MLFRQILNVLENNDGCKNNTENLFTTKVHKHILSSFSMSTISSFKIVKSLHEKCCKYLREHAMEIINFKKKKWSYKQKSSRNHIKMQKLGVFVQKKLKINMLKIKNIVKLGIIVIIIVIIIVCKYRHDDKKCETCGIKYKYSWIHKL